MEDVKLNRRDFLIASGIAAGGATALTSLQSCNSSDPFVPPDSEDDTCGKGNGDVPLYRAVGQALSDAGAGVVTTVPATDDVQIFDTYCEESGRTPFYSFNEEVAFTVAHAAALYGTRSATVIKSHGLAKASNSVVDALTCGTTAGLVVVSVNDMYGKGSETMFESLPFTRGLEIPMRKPCVRDIYREVQEAFEQSERMELPVVVYVEREQLNIGISVKRQTVDPPDHSFRRDGGIHILSPLLAEYQHEVRNAKRKGRDWRQIPRPQPPVIPDSLPEKWQPIVELYMPFFDALKSVRTGNSFVVSDTSVAVFFGYEPYECVDVSTYFGGSLPTAIGAQMGGRAGCLGRLRGLCLCGGRPHGPFRGPRPRGPTQGRDHVQRPGLHNRRPRHPRGGLRTDDCRL